MKRRRNLSSSRMKNARHYRSGWLPHFPDHRDKLYQEIMKRPSVLSSRVDLREHCAAVKFQRHLQSCTSHAIAAALELLEKRDRVHFDDMSRLFIYYNERQRVGTTAIDSGARIRDGIVELPRKDEAVIGGHAVLVVSYEDRRNRFLVRNSWGKNWGQEGYCTMPYEYLENRHYSTDFWTIHRAASL